MQKSHLFIAVDVPYRDKDVRINKKIIEYAKSIIGYKEITLFIRRENLGALQNMSLAWKDIFNNYENLILFEDDEIVELLNFSLLCNIIKGKI